MNISWPSRFIFQVVFGALFISASQTACVSLKPPSLQQRFQQRSALQRLARRRAITHWLAQGAFSVSQPGSDPLLANYRWQQSGPGHYRLQLSAALRAVVVSVVGVPGRVSLYRANHPPLVASTPDALLAKQIGWRLPIHYLYYWLRAVPVPQLAPLRQQLDNDQHLVRLQQAGWNIIYSHYKTINGVDLPSMLKLQHQQLRLRIVVKQWQLLHAK